MSGPLLPEDVRRQGQTAALRANLFTSTTGFVLTGQLMVLFLSDVLRWTPGQIALAQALAPVGGAVRLAFLGVIDRFGWVNSLLLGGWLRVAIVCLLLALPASWLSLTLFLALQMALVLAQEIGAGSVWQPLMRDLTSSSDRGSFFARMRFSFMTYGSLVNAGISAMVGASLSERTYKIALAIALFGLVGHVWFARRIPEAPRPASRRMPGLRELLAALRTAPVLRLPLVISTLLALAAPPIAVVYLRQGLHLPAGLVSWYVLAGTIGTALSLLMWGRIADAVGYRNLLVGQLVLSILLAPLWLLIAPAGAVGTAAALTPPLLLAMGILNGAVMAGIGIATISIQHHYTEQDGGLESITLFSIAGQVVGAAVALTAGAWLEHVALPGGTTTLAGGVLWLDPMKWWLVGGSTVALLIALIAASRLPNLRPGFGVGDFFSSLTESPLRSLLAQRERSREDTADRAALARWLGEHPNPMNLDLLAGMADDPAYDVRVEAVRALGRMGSAAAGARLIDLLDDDHEHLSDQVCWALGELAYAPAGPALRARLAATQPPRTRAMAARALGRIGSREALPDLIQVRDDPAVPLSVRAAAAVALMQIDPDTQAQASLALVPQLNHKLEARELLFEACRWRDLPSAWMLTAPAEQPLRQALIDHARRHGGSTAVVGILEQRDLGALLNQPLPPELRRLIEGLPTWTALHLFACAWLLFSRDGAG